MLALLGTLATAGKFVIGHHLIPGLGSGSKGPEAIESLLQGFGFRFFGGVLFTLYLKDEHVKTATNELITSLFNAFKGVLF